MIIQRKLIFTKILNNAVSTDDYKFMKLRPYEFFNEDLKEQANFESSIRDRVYETFTRRRAYVIPFNKDVYQSLRLMRGYKRHDSELFIKFVDNMSDYYLKNDYDAIMFDDDDNYIICKYKWFDESTDILKKDVFIEGDIESYDNLYDCFLKNLVKRDKRKEPTYDIEFADYLMSENILIKLKVNIQYGTWRYEYRECQNDILLPMINLQNFKEDLSKALLDVFTHTNYAILFNSKYIIYPSINDKEYYMRHKDDEIIVDINESTVESLAHNACNTVTIDPNTHMAVYIPISDTVMNLMSKEDALKIEYCNIPLL